MSGPNPFDQFADDFRAAIPGAPTPAPASSEPVLTMGPPVPAPAPKPSGPPMNAPPPMANLNQGYGYGGPPQMGAGGPMYGGVPPNSMGLGGPPPIGAPQMGNFSQMGGPPPLNNGMGGGMALVPSAQQSNPYANMLGGPPAPPPQQAPWGQPPPPVQQNQWGGPPQMQQQPPASVPESAPVPPPPPQTDAMNAWGPAPPMQPAPPVPTQDTQHKALPESTPNFDIFGAGPTTAPPVPPDNAPEMPPFQPAPPPQQQPLTQAPPPQQTTSDLGFGGVFDPMSPPAPAPVPTVAPPATDPWGPSAPSSTAVVAADSSDPFGGIFGSPTPAPAVAAPSHAPPPQPTNDDFFGDMGFGAAMPASSQTKHEQHDDNSTLGGGTISDIRNVNATVHPESDFFSSGPSATVTNNVEPQPKKSLLPEGGEYFDARIFTPTLGVMFFKPQELTDSLFLQTDREIVDALEERPVVAFIVEGSSARSAGVELGNVLLKVNGIDVKNPKEASRLIKEGPRPLPLLFYVPNTNVVVAEGEHMVKYDTRETGAPLSAKDWKPKYVVIGGIIAQPWMMNMYRSKVSFIIGNTLIYSIILNS